MDARTAAVRIVTDVLTKGRSLGQAADAYLAQVDPPEDKPLTRELSFGVLRWQPRLAAMLDPLLQKPLRGKDRDLYSVLLVGLYQLLYTRIPAHAAVAETVSVARRLDKEWASGLVNGVLRGFQRRQVSLAQEADRSETARWAHPAWLIAAIHASWPDHWRFVLTANNRHPPLSLRVNRRKTTRADYLAMIKKRGIEAAAIPHTDQGIVVTPPVDTALLPEFAAGWCTVQDGAAQLAAPLLDIQRGHRVLDACCAPGGKTTHLLELQPDIELTALDKSQRRLRQVEENLVRTGLHAAVTAGDAATAGRWWDGRPFDRILLDAPCSATGVIRRHPDIKVLRRPADIAAAAELQRRLLTALWPLLKPGGMILYTTCSVLAPENQDQIEWFIDTHGDALEHAIDAPWGHKCSRGVQVLPGDDDMDGFYFARLIKHSSRENR